MTDNRHAAEDPAAIEREVRRTQDAIGDTVQKLEEKMNPQEVARAAVGDDGADIARELLDIVRHNPVPVALIAVGAIWLLATARSPALGRLVGRVTGSETRPRTAGLRPRSAEPAPIGPSPAVAAPALETVGA